MTIKEILTGIEYRIKNLEQTIEVLEKSEGMEGIIERMEERLDENQVLYSWIKENSDEE